MGNCLSNAPTWWEFKKYFKIMCEVSKQAYMTEYKSIKDQIKELKNIKHMEELICHKNRKK